ncbi:MBL fold metallo-hydrolase [Enterococcus columbae]|uniref:Metallo-beta-lactamase n=1 Tax=Enterococcus columbae DSM 7374 = ATCC 51263 TaxID=1121865 RepID=S0KP74_9ENTE|nr:MBL fold metallo-hydrolase [Enterococcus columbae]EOT41848.1 metallo-beta-lactamase [Enterococcus columbae DSM 7374 = ATCC 51263]EOW80643.1 metallo-beta-lactamase [Enterococcus columbae DSM 7374 = ATCC 51263]OJG26274.1 metallo-beta-lactamase [Enterococcus columbae DSM 7374 = ATCC 51263]
MKLTILGCMGAYPSHNQGTTGYLLESGDYKLLLDAGSHTLMELGKHIDPLRLDAVILSHYHHDHIADLGVLQYMWQLSARRDHSRILPIYGHGNDVFHFNDLTMNEVSQGIDYLKVKQLNLGPFSVTFMKTIHPVECYAMRFVENSTGKVFVFTGDSGYLDSFVEFTKDANLFLADTYLFNGAEKHHAHFTAQESGQIAKAAKVERLVLTHLPEEGDWQLLQAQAQQEAGENVQVTIAKVGDSYQI